MEFIDIVLLLISGVGVVHGLLLSIFFSLIKSDRIVQDYIFAGLIFSLTIRIAKSIWVIFFDYPHKTILQIGLSFAIMIGPLLYLYIRHSSTKSKPTKSFSISTIVIPSLIILVIGLIRPYFYYPQVWNSIVIFIIYGVWTLYMLLAFFEMIKIYKNKAFVNGFSKIWISSVFASVFLIWAFYHASIIFKLSQFYKTGPIVFSIAFYVLAFMVFLHRNRKQASMHGRLKVSKNMAKELWSQTNNLVQTESLYLNPRYKISDLAKALDTQSYILSDVFNQFGGLSFTEYINTFRIEKAKELILTRNDLSMEGIGFEAGFSSKSNFYSVFKKNTQTTPTNFLKTHK